MILMATSKKSVVSFKVPGMMLFLFLALVLQSQLAKSQDLTCPRALANLNVCAQSVVPGAPNTPPNPECCRAVQAVPNDCICTTIQIASRLPSRCNLPVLNCSSAN